MIQGRGDCNWLQILETTIDSSHVSFLHQTWLKSEAMKAASPNLTQALQDGAPVYEIEPTPYGFHAAAIRTLANNTRYVRVSEYVAPFISFIPRGENAPKFTNIVVPVDDEHTLHSVWSEITDAVHSADCEVAPVSCNIQSRVWSSILITKCLLVLP